MDDDHQSSTHCSSSLFDIIIDEFEENNEKSQEKNNYQNPPPPSPPQEDPPAPPINQLALTSPLGLTEIPGKTTTGEEFINHLTSWSTPGTNSSQSPTEKLTGSQNINNNIMMKNNKEPESIVASRALGQQQENEMWASACDLDDIDPQEASFIMIQKEHEALKNELLNQQSLITDSFSNLRIQLDRKATENQELREKISELEREQRHERKFYENLNSQVAAEESTSKALREDIDELTAKLLLANDVQKYQEAMIKQMRGGGNSPADQQQSPNSSMIMSAPLTPPVIVNYPPQQPPRSPSLYPTQQQAAQSAGMHLLASAPGQSSLPPNWNGAQELAEKQAELNKCKARMAELDSTLLKRNEDIGDLRGENDELKSHIAALQIQVVEYRTYIEDLRLQVNQRRNRSSGQDQDTTVHVSQFVEACPKCTLLIADVDLYTRHVRECQGTCGGENNNQGSCATIENDPENPIPPPRRHHGGHQQDDVVDNID